MMFTAFGRKVPGSYVRKQLNILSYFEALLMLYFRHYHEPMEFMFDAYIIRAGAMVFITIIVIRFLMHIHSLRLLPGIGHFVITTFMMGTNLLHFSAVFGIVLFIFSVLFHNLLDYPKCPLEKMAEFATLHDSIFATFRFTFAHGDLDTFFSSAPVKLTYILYVIIVGLLLLNLIIAVMSDTATHIMAHPWKEVLWNVEWLDEATSVEYAFSMITLPFRRLHGFEYYFHKRAGFIVKKTTNNKYKIFIEHFLCPALEEDENE